MSRSDKNKLHSSNNERWLFLILISCGVQITTLPHDLKMFPWNQDSTQLDHTALWGKNLNFCMEVPLVWTRAITAKNIP